MFGVREVCPASRVQGLASSMLGCATRGSRWALLWIYGSGFREFRDIKGSIYAFDCSPTVNEYC